MKKVLALALTLVFAVVMLGCDKTTSATTVTTPAPVAVEFNVDGEFTAYAVSVSSNAPVVTSVTVTIEDGEIAGYFIDCRQGKRTATTVGEVTTYSFAWNAQTKKELGFGYKMHYSTYTTWAAAQTPAQTPSDAGYATWMGTAASEKLEWFEQANLLEAYWLQNGLYSAEVTSAGKFSNVAGVTVSNSSYTALAREAVGLARQGKFQAIDCSGTDLYIAWMIVNELGEVTELELDTLQATTSTTEGTFAWKSFTKQEFGDNYGMDGTGAKYSLVGGVWTASATEKSALEWNEQADLITDYILENGWNGNLKPVTDTASAARGVSLNGTAVLDGFAGVTIKTEHYFTVLGELFDCLAE